MDVERTIAVLEVGGILAEVGGATVGPWADVDGPAVRAARIWASLSPATRRAYKVAWARFRNSGLPLSDNGLAAHVDGMREAGYAHSTISLSAAAVRKVARATGKLADMLGEQTTAALQRSKREASGRGPGQVAAAGWDVAEFAARLAERKGTVRGIRDAAIVAVMSDGLLRVSEAAELRFSDVSRRADGSGRLAVRRSKTDQAGEGAVLYLGPPTWRRVRAWTRAASIVDGALFRRLARGGNVLGPLSVRSVRAVVQSRLRKAGAEGRVSGHSLRIGSACSMVRRGAAMPELCLAGRWKDSRMPVHYAKGETAGRGAVARLRYGAA